MVSSITNYLKYEEIKLVLGLLQEFEDLFDSTLGQQDSAPVGIDIKLEYNPVIYQYYTVTIVNKETYQK